MKKKLCFFDHSWQAEIFISELQANKISADGKLIPREYYSIITGMGHSPTEIFVEEKDLELAKKLLQKFTNKNSSQIHLAEETDPIAGANDKYYQRVLFFSLASIVFLPLIFNIVALINFKEMLKHPHTKKMKAIAIAVLITGLYLSSYVAYLIFKNY